MKCKVQVAARVEDKAWAAVEAEAAEAAWVWVGNVYARIVDTRNPIREGLSVSTVYARNAMFR